MMNRRFFLASTAAIAIAPSVPAQPARAFFGIDPAAGSTAWFLQAGDGVALHSMAHPVTYPLGGVWSTEPIDYQALVTIGRKYTAGLAASMQEVKARSGANILNTISNSPRHAS